MPAASAVAIGPLETLGALRACHPIRALVSVGALEAVRPLIPLGPAARMFDDASLNYIAVAKPGDR